MIGLLYLLISACIGICYNLIVNDKNITQNKIRYQNALKRREKDPTFIGTYLVTNNKTCPLYSIDDPYGYPVTVCEWKNPEGYQDKVVRNNRGSIIFNQGEVKRRLVADDAKKKNKTVFRDFFYQHHFSRYNKSKYSYSDDSFMFDSWIYTDVNDFTKHYVIRAVASSEIKNPKGRNTYTGNGNYLYTHVTLYYMDMNGKLVRRTDDQLLIDKIHPEWNSINPMDDNDFIKTFNNCKTKNDFLSILSDIEDKSFKDNADKLFYLFTQQEKDGLYKHNICIMFQDYYDNEQKTEAFYKRDMCAVLDWSDVDSININEQKECCYSEANNNSKETYKEYIERNVRQRFIFEKGVI